PARCPVAAQRGLAAPAVLAGPASEADLGDDAVAFLQALDAGTDLGHRARELMAERDRGALAREPVGLINGDAHRAVAVLLDVRATDPAPRDPQDDLAGSGAGDRDVLDADV